MTDVRLTATNPDNSSVVPVACNERGELRLEEPLQFDGNLDGSLDVEGSGTFHGPVKSEAVNDSSKWSALNEGYIVIQDPGADEGSIYLRCRTSSGVNQVEIRGSGSVSFANNQAGFTSEGYLFCKTLRGNIVMLNNLVNGLGEWVEYTPDTRKDLVQEKPEEKREERSEKDNSSESQ